MAFENSNLDFAEMYYNVLFRDLLSRNLAKRGIVMNLKEKVYRVIMNELNIKDNDNFIIQYYTDGSRRELECVFKNGELKNAFTYDNLSGKMLATLLAEDTIIKKKPWIPKKSEEYYYYEPSVDIIRSNYFSDINDIALYKMGNCFKYKNDITNEVKEEVTRKYREVLGE